MDDRLETSFHKANGQAFQKPSVMGDGIPTLTVADRRPQSQLTWSHTRPASLVATAEIPTTPGRDSKH